MKVLRKYILLIAILLIPVILFFIPRFIRIQIIECHSQYGVCSSYVLSDLDSVKKGDLNTTKKEIEKILKNELLVRDYQVYFKFPGTLQIDVVEKKPKFSLTTADRQKYALIDKDGYVLSVAETSDLPGIVSKNDVPEKGSTVSAHELFAMSMVYDVYSLYQIKQGNIDNESLVIELPDELRVIFPLEGDRQELVGKFMLLYNEIVRNGDAEKLTETKFKIKEIDLRFKNPILR